jgi:hypothetical protein
METYHSDSEYSRYVRLAAEFDPALVDEADLIPADNVEPLGRPSRSQTRVTHRLRRRLPSGRLAAINASQERFTRRLAEEGAQSLAEAAGMQDRSQERQLEGIQMLAEQAVRHT